MARAASVGDFRRQLPQAGHAIRPRGRCVVSPVPEIFRAASPTSLSKHMAMGKVVVANDQPEQKRVVEASDAGYRVPFEEQLFAAARRPRARTILRRARHGPAGARVRARTPHDAVIAAAVERQCRKSSRHAEGLETGLWIVTPLNRAVAPRIRWAC